VVEHAGAHQSYATKKPRRGTGAGDSFFFSFLFFLFLLLRQIVGLGWCLNHENLDDGVVVMLSPVVGGVKDDRHHERSDHPGRHFSRGTPGLVEPGGPSGRGFGLVVPSTSGPG
jgi:hypothetical protein